MTLHIQDFTDKTDEILSEKQGLYLYVFCFCFFVLFVVSAMCWAYFLH